MGSSRAAEALRTLMDERSFETPSAVDLAESLARLVAELDAGELLGDGDVAAQLEVALSRINSGGAADAFAEALDIEVSARLFDAVIAGLSTHGDEVGTRRLGHELLDLFRRRPILRQLAGDAVWERRLLELLRASRFHVGHLFDQRVRDHARQPPFSVLRNNRPTSHTFAAVPARVDAYRRELIGLLAKLGKPHAKVGLVISKSKKTLEDGLDADLRASDEYCGTRISHSRGLTRPSVFRPPLLHPLPPGLALRLGPLRFLALGASLTPGGLLASLPFPARSLRDRIAPGS